MEDHSVGSDLEQSCDSDVDTDSDDSKELVLEEGQPAPTSQQRIKSFLRKNWRNVLVLVCLWIAFSLCTAAFSLIAPFFPKEAYDKGASEGVIGFIFGVPPLVVVLLSPPLGYILPLVGVSWYILVGLLLVGTSYILLAFVISIPSTWGFILACIFLRAAEGAGSAMFYTATYSTFPKFFPKSVSLLMSIFQTANGFGYTLGRPIGGLLYHFQLGPVGVSWVLFILAASFSISSFFAGMASDKLRSVFVSVFGLVVIAAGLFFMGIQDYIHYWKLWVSYVSVTVIAMGAAFAIIPIYNTMIITSKRYLICETDSQIALVSFVSGIVSASACLGQYLGPVLGGVLSDFVSFPITSAIMGFVILAQALLLIGVHLIHNYT